MATLIDFVGFRNNLRDAIRAGIMDTYDPDQVNVNSMLIPDRSSPWVEIYLAGSEHEPVNLGNTRGIPVVDRVIIRAEVRCVSQNQSVADAIDERDILVSRTIKAIYDNKYDFSIPGAVVVGTAFNDRTDESTTECIVLVAWLTEG